MRIFSKNRYLKPKKKHLAMVLSLLLLVTGCAGQETTGEAVPELIEPAGTTDPRRTVEIKSMGDEDAYTGFVSGRMHNLTMPANGYELAVSYGDHVEEGDLIARPKPDGQIEALEESMSDLNFTQDIERQREGNAVKRIEIEMQRAEAEGNTSKYSNLQVELSVLNENNSYQETLRQSAIKSIQNDINTLKEEDEAESVYADTSGYLTFLYDKLVITSDTEYIVRVNEGYSAFTDYESFYGICGDSILRLELEAMSQEEIVALESSDCRSSRFIIAEEDRSKVEPGEPVVVVGRKNAADNVLCVYNDSVVSENDRYYVYKDVDGVRTKTEIEIGAVSESETEVLSGLSEGDVVYYTSDDLIYDNYEECTVTEGEYISSDYIGSLPVLTYEEVVTVKVPEGVINAELIEYCVEPGQYVNEGDRIALLKNTATTSSVTELNNQIKDLDASYERSGAETDGYISMLKSQLELMQTAPDASAYDIELLKLDISDAELDKKQAEADYNAQRKSLSAEVDRLSAVSGDVYVKAPVSGYVQELGTANPPLSEGIYTQYEWYMQGGLDVEAYFMSEGDAVITINPESDRVLCIQGSSMKVDFGLDVSVTDGNTGETFTGEVLSAGGPYVEIDSYGTDVKNYYSFSGSYNYISLDDAETFEAETRDNVSVRYNLVELSSVISVPGTAVNIDYYGSFVWVKDASGNVVKKYISADIKNQDGQMLVTNGLTEGEVVLCPITGQAAE